MLRNAARKVVEFGNSSRKISLQAMDPIVDHLTKFYPGYSVVATLVSAYTLGSFFILRIQLSPIERIMAEMKQETKLSIEKLGTEMKERTDKLGKEIEKLGTETKESFDKLEMQMKESNNTINSRLDSVLLRSLDLQRVPKPTGE
jgi:hypothetical protein